MYLLQFDINRSIVSYSLPPPRHRTRAAKLDQRETQPASSLSFFLSLLPTILLFFPFSLLATCYLLLTLLLFLLIGTHHAYPSRGLSRPGRVSAAAFTPSPCFWCRQYVFPRLILSYFLY